ncbi:CRY2-like protein [Mya arenaria]|uniref:CRY2-like protein n=1 Tax=Mya arenaria TaxID=6604 RepID=A0ABY7E1Z0_MYAAR|nr:CRY2-like protein [Mya arenaria]
MAQRSIHWFRKGLRLHDNPALMAACDGVTHMRAVFVLDPWFATQANVGVNRWRFLLQALKDLDNSLQKYNSRLFVVRGKPADVFPKLFKDWGITLLTYEVDTEPYAVSRDEEIDRLAQGAGVKVTRCVSHTLYDTQMTIAKNGGSPPLTYQRLQTVLSQLGPPPKPVEIKEKLLKACSPVLEEEHDKQYGNWVCSFEKPKTEPNSLEPSTTVLSPYLKFGCLSPRIFYYGLVDAYKGKKHSMPPVSLHGQLLWREFFTTVGAGTPNFDQMEGNQVCTQVDWEENTEWLEAWKMLRLEGWIHHLGRHAVACFLTRGDLWVSWEHGQRVFEDAFFHQYFRVYSPVVFGKKTDKNGDFIRKYIPKLSKFPEKYIYEPWTAPRAVQEKCGCIIGRDYPKPIVNHDEARKKNIARMAAAYARRNGAKEAAAGGKGGNKAGGKRKAEGGGKKSSKKAKVEKHITDFLM